MPLPGRLLEIRPGNRRRQRLHAFAAGISALRSIPKSGSYQLHGGMRVGTTRTLRDRQSFKENDHDEQLPPHPTCADDDVRDLAGRHEWNADDGGPGHRQHDVLSGGTLCAALMTNSENPFATMPFM
jgi:hypothetical protein